MGKITEIVRLGRDNPFELTVTYDGAPVDFSAATGFELQLAGLSVTAGIVGDSLGKLTFNIQDEALPVGLHSATLIVTDAEHLDGQVIVDEHSLDQLLVKVV